jgi:lysozyme
MTPSLKAIKLIKKYEGFRSDSYLCPANVPTIGYGNTMWPDGKKVKLGQRISMEEADKLLMWEITNKTKALPKLSVNQNMFDSICSFIYNCGVGAFLRSTMYKKINVNPFDPTIRDEFMRWINKGSAFENGMRKRRKEEADLYFTPYE